ncbi:MAG: 50S ribosomal protein L35 [Dehalococcoidia bacterium]
MPKLKTHKGAKSRFHITGSGKIMRVKGGKSHLRRKKPARVRRLYDETILLHPANKKRIQKLLPYGLK